MHNQNTPSRQQMLRDFLRWKRSTASRESIGLPPRPGHHGGVSQADLAEATGYAVRTIAYLERGAAHPSRDLLDRIASALRLSPDETRTLWRLAAGAEPPGQGYLTAPDAGLARMTDALMPHPAYVTDLSWTVLAANRAAATWLSGWLADIDNLPPERRNMAQWIMCDPHSQHVFARWEETVAPSFVAQVRAVWSRFPEDAALQRLIGQLRTHSTYVDQWWDVEASVYVAQVTEQRWMRQPGHTDPNTADASQHETPVSMVILQPMRPEDERRLVTFLLPAGHPEPRVRSDDACTACR